MDLIPVSNRIGATHGDNKTNQSNAKNSKKRTGGTTMEDSSSLVDRMRNHQDKADNLVTIKTVAPNTNLHLTLVVVHPKGKIVALSIRFINLMVVMVTWLIYQTTLRKE